MQLAWVLERVGSGLPGLRCTTQPELWLGGEAELFVWEAFVSGAGKPVPSGITQHAADAAAAADTFADRLAEESLNASDVVCTPASSFNLAAAAAAYAGLAIAGAELRGQVQVYRTRPALKRPEFGQTSGSSKEFIVRSDPRGQSRPPRDRFAAPQAASDTCTA